MKAEKVRAAKAFLKRRGLTKPPASMLARASAELGLGFAATLAYILRLKQGPQNQSGQRREFLHQLSLVGE